MRILSFVLLITLAPAISQGDVVFQLEDLGAATQINGNNTAGIVVGQKANAATVFSGGTTTQIASSSSTANGNAGVKIVGTSQNLTPLGFRYDISTNTPHNFPVPAVGPTYGVDIISNGTALLYNDTVATDRAVIWRPDNSANFALSGFTFFVPRGLSESSSGVGYDPSNNMARFFSFSDLSNPTANIANYDPTAGFEGNLTAGKRVSDNVPAYYQVSGTLTVVPKLDPLNVSGEVTAFNTAGQLVGNWDSEFFLYDINTNDLLNLSTLTQTGDPFASISVPTVIAETGMIYGTGLVEESPGVFVSHAYKATLVPVPEPSSLALWAVFMLAAASTRIRNRPRSDVAL
jgi:hypothetical protein